MFVVSGSGDVDESVSLLQCQQVADELKQTARRAAHLYQQVSVQTDDMKTSRRVVISGEVLLK